MSDANAIRRRFRRTFLIILVALSAAVVGMYVGACFHVVAKSPATSSVVVAASYSEEEIRAQAGAIRVVAIKTQQAEWDVHETAVWAKYGDRGLLGFQATATAVVTPTQTFTPTLTPSPLPTQSPRPTSSPIIIIVTATLTPTETPTVTATPTWTPRPTVTLTPTQTWTPTPTATLTPRPTPDFLATLRTAFGQLTATAEAQTSRIYFSLITQGR